MKALADITENKDSSFVMLKLELACTTCSVLAPDLHSLLPSCLWLEMSEDFKSRCPEDAVILGYTTETES